MGEITGHSKAINSIDYRPVRPFRVVTAGEDHLVCHFEGPPFKYSGVQKVRKSSSRSSHAPPPHPSFLFVQPFSSMYYTHIHTHLHTHIYTHTIFAPTIRSTVALSTSSAMVQVESSSALEVLMARQSSTTARQER